MPRSFAARALNLAPRRLLPVVFLLTSLSSAFFYGGGESCGFLFDSKRAHPKLSSKLHSSVTETFPISPISRSCAASRSFCQADKVASLAALVRQKEEALAAYKAMLEDARTAHAVQLEVGAPSPLSPFSPALPPPFFCCFLRFFH